MKFEVSMFMYDKTNFRHVCLNCRTKKEPRYQCRNLPSIGFFEGWVCDNCGHRERV